MISIINYLTYYNISVRLEDEEYGYMADKIIIFSGKQYSGKDTLAKIRLANMKDYKRCAMGDIIKLEYGTIVDKKHWKDAEQLSL